MTDEARQCYHLDINKKMKLCTQNPVLEEVAQAVDSNQIINIEDWNITFKAFHPDRIRQLKKHASEESQDKGIRDYVSNVVKKATMLIIVQQSVRGFCLITMDYIASSMEKMDILLVGVQNRIVINPKIEVSIPLLLVKHTIARILKQEKHVSNVIKRDIS
jgi:hypothetical protein